MAESQRQSKNRHCRCIHHRNAGADGSGHVPGYHPDHCHDAQRFCVAGLYAEGESLFSYRGKPLPYMPFCYQHPDYWHCIAAESKRTGDMVNSRKLFDDSEAAHPIRPEEFIPIENIRGKLLLIGAEDDVLWDTAKYIRRMEKRFAEKPHACEVETAVYAHGTHFVFPEGMLKTMLPVGSGLFVKFAFQAAKKYPKECCQTRKDIEKRMCQVLAEQKGAK